MSLTGKFLIAMPQLSEGFFTRTVIYLCSHTDEGAMGIVINRHFDSIDYDSFLQQLGVPSGDVREQIRIHVGGPVEPNRGFVLHSTDVVQAESMVLDEGLAMTATPEILREILRGRGPERRLFALGYAGWGAGQLDQEIQSNTWLHVDYDQRLMFDTRLDSKWERALGKLGITPLLLSQEAGTA